MLFKEEDMNTLFDLIDLRKIGSVTREQMENCLLNLKFEKDIISMVLSKQGLKRIEKPLFVKMMGEIIEKSKLQEKNYM